MMSNSLNGAVAQPPVRRSKHAPTPMFGPNEIAQIKADLALPGSTQAAVARKWGVTSSVISRIGSGHYSGRPRGRKPKASPEKVKQIVAELQVPGSTARDVAKKFGVSLATVKRIRGGLYVSKRTPVAAPSHAAFLDELIRFLRTITALVELERRRYE